MDAQVVLITLGICALLGAAIGSGKGMPVAGLFLGGLLGIIGVIIIAVAKPKNVTPAANAGWWPDPRGRYTKRYYDGTVWTPHVMDGDVQTVDEHG